MQQISILLLLTLLIQGELYCQSEKSMEIFHRLLILNDSEEIMIAKIESPEYWVTPGIYQSRDQSIKKGLDSLALTYGIEINAPQLKGLFILNRNINGVKSTSLRNVYTAYVSSNDHILPEGISEIKWLTPNEAIELLTFPHIGLMIKQVMDKPDQVSAGTLSQFKEDGKWKSEIVETFYSLSNR